VTIKVSASVVLSMASNAAAPIGFIEWSVPYWRLLLDHLGLPRFGHNVRHEMLESNRSRTASNGSATRHHSLDDPQQSPRAPVSITR
jgi:hypothetical protein